MEYQVRRYRIRDGKLSEFAELWRDAVVPLREAYGFEVQGAWALEVTGEFVWVVGHATGFASADEAYYHSDERKALDPDPATYIEEVNETMAVRVWPAR
jgi:hypothetical protein